MPQREGTYKSGLKKRIEQRFPGCLIIPGDANDMQGIPDLIVLWNDNWAALEVKASYADRKKNAQPNQEEYVLLMDGMSFAAFVYPENEGDVLDALQRAFQPARRARISQRQQMALDQLRSRQADRHLPQRATG